MEQGVNTRGNRSVDANGGSVVALRRGGNSGGNMEYGGNSGGNMKGGSETGGNRMAHVIDLRPGMPVSPITPEAGVKAPAPLKRATPRRVAA